MNELNYDITPISLEYFKQRSFEIIFNVFNSMNSSEDELIKDYVLTIGSDELYESLKYHNDIFYSSILTKNYELMVNFFVWKYSVYNSRGINLDCFLKEYEFWKESILNYLYPSHASEINVIYDYLIFNHQNFKIEALKAKNIVLDKKYQSLFDELLRVLLSGERNQFYNLITQLSHIVNHKFLYKKASLNPINRHFLI